MHTLHNDPQEHLHEDAGILWIFGAAPLLAATDTLTNALGICCALLLASVASTLLAATLLRTVDSLLRLTASVILTAALMTALLLLANAWLPSLHASLGVFPYLIACNLLLLSRLQFAATLGPWRALRTALAAFAPVLLVLLILGTLRELVGRGSLLHDIALLRGGLAGLGVQLFTADLGFLLGLLPPGAFISFAVLLALRNWLRLRRDGSKEAVETE
jgi:Na+-translocating ferredoxin:NAD+ oxidoreductase subunit E